MGLARTVAAVFGVVYVLVGVLGFVLATPLFGLFEVNPVHNIVHIALGAILLYGTTATTAAIQTTRLVGAILVIVGILGFVSADGFGILPLGGNDIWLHLGSGVILLAVGFFATGEPAAA
jgi:Domain of unknown function (DUF4383)